MIFSTVVSNGMHPDSAMWISKPPNVLNVAMTRARRKLIIVGDMNYCGNNYSGEMLGKLSEYCKKIDKLEKISMEQKRLYELLILNGINPEIEYPIADMHVDFLVSSQLLINSDLDSSDCHTLTQINLSSSISEMPVHTFTSSRFNIEI